MRKKVYTNDVVNLLMINGEHLEYFYHPFSKYSHTNRNKLTTGSSNLK